ncbi:MAG: LptF/LptG family permease [Candidatus Latescibacteria bacterium]|nr:LptF/LptG family permease [Candidatus Latescibacterota bacterium]
MTFDRFIIKEFFKYLILGVACVVTIYLLIDLFEELNYFITRRASVFIVLIYYLYSLPFALSLLFPVGVILSCFFVYGSLTRERSLYVFQIAGVNLYRLFAPVIVVGIILIFAQFWFIELVTIPANRKLENLKRNTIEKRQSQMPSKRSNLYVRGKERTVYFIKEFETQYQQSKISSGIMRNFIIAHYTRDGRIEKRIDAVEAHYTDNRWIGSDVTLRTFDADTLEIFTNYDTLTLSIIEKPDFFVQETRNIEELQIWELHEYIEQLKIAGINTAKAEVELHYRFANAFIVLILMLISLPLAIRLRHGGVMLGLGLGLLFAFVYWGLIQVNKAFGQVLLLNPFLAAWLANFMFLSLGIYLLIQVRKYA